MGVALVEFLDQAVAHKPLDASDCTTLEFAKRELSRLRRVTAKVVKVLRDADNAVKQHAEHQNGFMKENSVLNGQAKANKADLLEKYRPKSTRSRSAPASNTDRDQKNPQEDEAGRRDSKASSSTPMTGCSQSTEKRNHVKGRSKSRTKSRSKSKARNKKKKSNKKRKNLSVDLSYQKYIKQTYDKSPEDRDLIKSALKNNQLFENFRDAQLEEFVDVFSPESFEEGSTVVRQATHGNTFYIVKSGTLKIYVDTIIDGRKMETQVGEPYGSGSAFGELALLYDSPRVATIRASEACVFWVIDRTAFKGLQLQLKQADHNIKLEHLKRVKVGNQMFADVLDDDQLERMALATQFENFKDGKAIFKEGEIGSNFYMIVTGQVDVYKDGGDYPINHLGPDTYFGERALLQSDGGCRTATCVAKTDVECLTLSREDFTDLLGSLDEIMVGRRQSLSLRQSSGDLIAPKAADLLSDDLGGDQGFTSYTLDGLKIKGVLGEGAFGRVHLAKGRQDGRLYALKAQGKHHIATNGSQTKVISEFGIMTDLNHPLIVRCYQAFQDTRYIYFLMSLLPGGDVLDLLEDKIKFSEDWARFYGATVVLTFEYIHSRKIAFRDLKPENLVLDADGYAHLVDFGLAKQIAGKTWTVCGTPDYVAPEIVKAEGHDWGCESWVRFACSYSDANY